MLLLAFDTATSAVTVALHDGDHVIARTTTSAVRQHGEFLAASIAALLSGAGAATAFRQAWSGNLLLLPAPVS